MEFSDGGVTRRWPNDHDHVVAALRRAIDLSTRGLGRVSPNPAVGCVIFDHGGHVIGAGWHERAGGDHAEVAAIADARANGHAMLAGSTAVITLEPCPHQGRTGPCTDALAEAGISRVIYAVADPLHSGGAQELRLAGIEVHGPGSDLLPAGLTVEATAINEAWLTAVRTSRPHVTWKFAATLDGRSAAADGTSRWITGVQAREDVHRLRDKADVVLVGARTQRTDDPELTVRPAPPDGRQPLRVVLDPHGRTDPHARIVNAAAPTLVLIGQTAPNHEFPKHVQVARISAALPTPGVACPHGTLDLVEALAVLFDREVRSVLLEGGPRLAGSFLAAGLVDRVIAYLAPALLGAGPAALTDAGVTTIDAAHRLEPIDITALGQDIRITARPVPTPN